MSEHTESNSPIATILGSGVLFLIPIVMIAMLGIVGFAFVGSLGEKEEVEETQKAAAAPAPAPVAPAPAPATPPEGDAPAPAAVEAPAAGGGEIDPAVMALGKTAYATCAACHGPDGQGLQVGPAKMAPSMTGSELLLGDPDGPLLVVLKGIAKENMDYMGMMAPLAAALDDEKLAAVLTYTRNSWGNSAPAVTVEQAAAARAKFADVNAPAGVKRAEIQQIVDAHK